MIRIVTIVGARPQFIKAAAISRAIRRGFLEQVEEVLVHTGQHFDENMSKVFFEELDIPTPKFNLEIAGGGHGAMTGRMLEAIESVLLSERPDWVLIYGDTNSTLAGSLAAAKLYIPVAHVEAGLRSFNMRMPEEVNRIVADRLSTLLLCPTEASIENLNREGITSGVSLVGDVMYDVSLFYRDLARERSSILKQLQLNEGSYVLATCHRAENTDDSRRLKSIVRALEHITEDGTPVVLPLHPRTRNLIAKFELNDALKKVMVLDPLPFLDMLRLEQSAKAILTDSGGVQKEAFFFKVPCITMRDETEWVETVATGWNTLTGANTEAIILAFQQCGVNICESVMPFGTGNAAEQCVSAMLDATVARQRTAVGR